MQFFRIFSVNSIHTFLNWCLFFILFCTMLYKVAFITFLWILTGWNSSSIAKILLSSVVIEVIYIIFNFPSFDLIQTVIFKSYINGWKTTKVNERCSVNEDLFYWCLHKLLSVKKQTTIKVLSDDRSQWNKHVRTPNTLTTGKGIYLWNHYRHCNQSPVLDEYEHTKRKASEASESAIVTNF